MLIHVSFHIVYTIYISDTIFNHDKWEFKQRKLGFIGI